jgi:hypothetical protein
MKKILAALPLLLVFAFCNSKKQTGTTVAATENITGTEDSTHTPFFPVTAFLLGQLAELDSLPVTFLHITTINGKTDSVWEKRQAVKPILQPFIEDNIDTANLTAFFKATKFNDQTIEAITFTYDPLAPLPDSIALRHWALYINPETGKINKVYIVREFNKDKTTFTQQLTWQTGRRAKINTLQQLPGQQKQLLKEEQLVWDFD